MSNSAAAFSTSTAYAAGDMCLYDGKLYIFTSSHAAGAWDDEDAKEYDRNTPGDVDRIVAGYKNALNAAGFVDTMAFEMSKISGTRYKFIATDAADPRN